MSMLYKMSSLTPNCESDYLGYRPFNCKYQMHKEQHESFNFMKVAVCRLYHLGKLSHLLIFMRKHAFKHYTGPLVIN